MTARARTLTILLLGALAAAAVALAARTVASASSRHVASVRHAGSAPHAGSARHADAHPAAATRANAGAQLNWLVGASRRLPISATEVAAHVAPVALKTAGDVAGVNQTLSALGPITPTRSLERRPDVAEALVNARRGPFVMTVGTGADGLIDELSLTPYLRGVGSWSALDAHLRALAPQVGFAAAELGANGRIRLLHGLHPDQARPLGSAFKLYVLGALGRAVAEHRAHWSERLRIRQAWKSLPSGVLQNEPAGTALPLMTFADVMISISDNTAADHLIHRVGRGAVEAQLRRFGNEHAQRTIPFPTTRELFALKGRDFPAAATRYLALSRRARRAALGRLDRVPLTSLRPWTTPRDTDSIEWFGSPSDIIRAYAGLGAENARPGLSAIGSALSINDSGLGLDRRSYPTVWFKGGSEPGVLTLTYLVRTRTGHTLVEALMLADPRRPIAPAATPELLALARSGISLSRRRRAISRHGRSDRA